MLFPTRVEVLPLAIVEHNSDDGSRYLDRDDSRKESEKEDFNKALVLVSSTRKYWKRGNSKHVGNRTSKDA